MRRRALLAALLLLPALARAGEAEGEQLFLRKCQACHGADGGGDMPLGRATAAPDLRTSPLTEAEMEKVVFAGRGKMMAFGRRFSAEQIDDVVEYVLKRIRPGGPVPRRAVEPKVPPPEQAAQ